MTNRSRLVRVAVAMAVLTAAAALRPARADANKHGLFQNPDGEYLCGSTCGAGQKCCVIVILPAG